MNTSKNEVIINCYSMYNYANILNFFLNLLPKAMLNNQCLYDRPMRVRMDKDNRDKEPKLPEGLSGIGPALRMPPSGHPEMPLPSKYRYCPVI